MAKIIKAAIGYSEMPAGFPILMSDQMAIIEPAFAYLLELAHDPGTLTRGRDSAHLWRAPA